MFLEVRNFRTTSDVWAGALSWWRNHLLNSGFVNPCIIIHSNKSTNQMHQSLRFIARLNTAQHSSQPDRPRPTTLLPPRSNGKPEAATAVYKLLMMGMRIPETCWAVLKRRTINQRDWCIWFFELFETICCSSTCLDICAEFPLNPSQ